jgi:nucleoside-diphosphate-sugar epimerase
VRQLAEMVRELTQTSAPLVERPLPEDDPKIRKPDITRARTMLGWEPKVGIREGLQKTIAYFASLPAERMRPRA